ncbi:unnamed protein product, partial [Urochloa humidicola]
SASSFPRSPPPPLSRSAPFLPQQRVAPRARSSSRHTSFAPDPRHRRFQAETTRYSAQAVGRGDGGRRDGVARDSLLLDSSEYVYISDLTLLKMLKQGAWVRPHPSPPKPREEAMSYWRPRTSSAPVPIAQIQRAREARTISAAKISRAASSSSSRVREIFVVLPDAAAAASDFGSLGVPLIRLRGRPPAALWCWHRTPRKPATR